MDLVVGTGEEGRRARPALPPGPLPPGVSPPGVSVQVLDLTNGGTGTHLFAGARAAVRAAYEDGFRRVVCGSAGRYGAAVAWAAAGLDMDALVVLPIGADPGMTALITAAGAQIVPAGDVWGQVLAASRARALPDRADVNVDGPYARQVLAGLLGAGDVVVAEAAAPDGLWLPVGSGATATAVGEQVLGAGWLTALYGVGITGGNSVVTSWPGAHRPVPGGRVPGGRVPGGADSLPATMAVQAPGWPLVRAVAEHGTAAMDMLRGTGGAAVGVDPADLVQARWLLARHGIGASAAGCAGLAGLLAQLTVLTVQTARGRAVTGRHVAVVTG